MKRIIFILCFILTLESFSENLFTPPKEEINKVGSYQVKTNSIPERFRSLWTNSRYNKIREDEAAKDKSRIYSTITDSFRWNIWTPKNYKPEQPAGIIVLPLSFNIEDIPQAWQFFCDTHNIIVISPELSDKLITCNPELILCSIDIIKSRYKVDKNRIYLCAISYQYYTEILCFPDEFSGYIFVESGLHFSREHFNKTLGSRRLKELDSLLKKKYFSFIKNNSNQKLPVENEKIEVESFDSGIEYYRTENGWNSVWMKQYIQKNSKYQYITINGQHETLLTQVDYFYGLDYTTLRDALKFLDTPIINKGKALINLGSQAEKLKQYKKAMDLYLQAKNHQVDSAQNKYNRLISLLKAQESKLRKHIALKEYFEAYQLATSLVKQYGSEHADFSKLAVKEFSADKEIVLEIKAAVFLSKAETALSQNPVPVDQIIAACEKVIKTVSGTKTAEKAKKILEQIK
ncbi:MAG: hypothetical protein NE328_05635 [Lentisphaeraceae bacterium]|nr:hypothetical protein [Lentisphaeraceae bacterium]